VAGAGLEWKFFDHWLLRGEWLHDHFDRVAIADDLFTAPFGLNVRNTVDVSRAALSYNISSDREPHRLAEPG